MSSTQNNKKVGSVDLNDDVLWRPRQDRPDSRVRRAPERRRTPRHARDQEPRAWSAAAARSRGARRAPAARVSAKSATRCGAAAAPRSARQPRSYEYSIPKKVEKGALRAALMQKLQEGSLIVIDALTASEVKTKAAVGVLKTIGVTGKAVLVDAQLDEKFAMSVRNIAGVSLVQSNRVTARDVANTPPGRADRRRRVEKLEAALGANYETH